MVCRARHFSFIPTKLISETMAFGLRNNGVLAQKQWRLTSETMAFWAQKQWRLMPETMAFALKKNGVGAQKQWRLMSETMAFALKKNGVGAQKQ